MHNELDLRKGVHIKLMPDTHAEFRILLIRRGLSMQEVFEEFAQRTITDDRSCIELLDDLIDKKGLKLVSQMIPRVAQSIFSAIELDDMAHKGSSGRSGFDDDEDD